jgi:hypothetical protein
MAVEGDFFGCEWTRIEFIFALAFALYGEPQQSVADIW